MLEVKDLSKLYGTKLAVDNMSFSLKKGEVLAFIGPNGAGKSTTMRMITGFIPATGGTVTIDGHDIDRDPLKAKAITGYLPENAPLYEHMTVRAFLTFIAEVRGYTGAEKRRKVDDVIDTCFLHKVVNQSVHTLSKGYRHRTCFAQAILHDPDLLILDEPTDGLDPNQKREVRNLIKSMGQTKAIIISTHILEEVEAVADRVVLIDQGAKVFDGTPDEFRQKSDAAGSIVLEMPIKEKELVANKLKALDGVEACTAIGEKGNDVVYRILPTQEANCEEVCITVLGAVKQENWKLEQFYIDRGQLTDVFAKMTHKDMEVK
jgi:ABC-2 type transport system ATP-binding protein